MSVWTAEQMRVLSRLREGFLAGTAGRSDYWAGPEVLELYDRTFAERIGWKWDAVLGELELKKWAPPSARLVDWGCGSGVAARRVLSQWPGVFGSLVVSDRSALARAYAQTRAREVAPGVEVKCVGPDDVDFDGAVVLLSHVLSELEDGAVRSLVGRLRRAAAVIWVESATHGNARRLVEEVREPLLSGGWKAQAPCTHSTRCPLMCNQHERHWCHHFARVPSVAHQDPAWRELSQRLNLDLRVLPYSFVVLEKDGRETEPPGGFRGLGDPREFKGHFKVLACDADRVEEWMVQKREAPELFKSLKKGGRVPLYRWRTEGNRVLGEDADE